MENAGNTTLVVFPSGWSGSAWIVSDTSSVIRRLLKTCISAQSLVDGGSCPPYDQTSEFEAFASTMLLLPSTGKDLVTSRRLILTITALIIVNSIISVLDNGVVKGSRRLETQLKAEKFSLQGVPSLGAHFVTLYVGSPAQPQHLMVSLATEFTSFPCLGCVNCGDHHAGRYFNYSKSLIRTCPKDCAFRKSHCEETSQQCIIAALQIHSEDTEGSFRGFEVSDTVYVMNDRDTKGRNKSAFTLDFICNTQVHGITQNLPGDGLLSLSTAPSSFISQMHAGGRIPSRIFSLCFNPVSQTVEGSLNLGSVSFGDTREGYHSSSLVWALNSGKGSIDSENYAIRINDILFGIGGKKNPLLNAARGTMSIVSLGSNATSFTPPEEWMRDATIRTNKPFTILPKKYEEAFQNLFLTLVGVAFNKNGIAMTRKKLDRMPTLFFQIEPHEPVQARRCQGTTGLAGRLDQSNPCDIIIAVPPQRYFLYDEKIGVAMPTVRFGNQGSSLGANVLQGHEVVFDIDQRRIGFAEVADCSDTSKPEGEPLSQTIEHPTNNSERSSTADTEMGQASRSGHGNGLYSELPGRGRSNQAEIDRGGGSGHSRGRSIDAAGGASDTQPVENSSGIPPADGQSTMHAGPGAVAAAEELKDPYPYNVDLVLDLCFLGLLICFGITFYLTRDKIDYGNDIAFHASDYKRVDYGVDENALKRIRRSSPGVFT